jgi:hypothetical protein
MNTDEILKSAIMLHSDTRDAVRWAIKRERTECAKLCEEASRAAQPVELADMIRQRNLK